MPLWVKGLPNRSDTLQALLTQEPLELLPDHLHALAYGIGILLGMLHRQMQICQDRQEGSQYIFLATVCSLLSFLGHASTIILELGLQPLQLIKIGHRQLTLLFKFIWLRWSRLFFCKISLYSRSNRGRL